MRHSAVRNYVVPGLTSYLIGKPSPFGTMRLFHSEREHQESITPHSHRFGFQCWVLRGWVRNRIWREIKYWEHDKTGDKWHSTELKYRGEFGEYDAKPGDIAPWFYEDSVYKAGACYGMTADDVHSIWFSRDALVLFFEGPPERDCSRILQPVADGALVPTFKVEPWMFERDERA